MPVVVIRGLPGVLQGSLAVEKTNKTDEIHDNGADQECHCPLPMSLIACHTPAGKTQIVLQTLMLHSWC